MRARACVYAPACVYMYVHACTCVHVCARACVCMYACAYACLCARVYSAYAYILGEIMLYVDHFPVLFFSLLSATATWIFLWSLFPDTPF